MLSADARSSIDRIWNVFWSNGMTNPLVVVEQITFIILMKLLDDNQIMQERNANLLGTKLKDPVFKKGVCVIQEDPRIEAPYEDLRWQNFRHKEPEEMFRIVRDLVFPFVKTLGSGRDSAFSRYMADAQFEISKPKVLDVAVKEIESMRLTGKDMMGDIYEELLDRIKSSGENGQFRSQGSLPGFVRSLVDIDEDAVQEKFGEFLSGGTLNQKQQEFVRAIVDYLRENGEVTPDDLTNDEPFVNYDIGSLFEDRIVQLREIIARLNEISGSEAA